MKKPDCSNPQLLVNEAALNLIYNGADCLMFGDKQPINRFNLHNIGVGKFFKMAEGHTDDELDSCVAVRGNITEQIFIYVPCRKCAICRQKRQYDYVFRADMESSLYDCPPYFFTLTYAPKFLPYNGELCYSDVQKFFKRLRINWTRNNLSHNVRYLVAGEYGSKYGRPHYHVILWNNPYHCNELMSLEHNMLKHDIFVAWSMCEPQSFDFGQCQGGAASYATKYVSKQTHYDKHFIQPFIRMSTGHGGIGSSVVKQNIAYLRNNLSCNEITYRKNNGELGRVSLGSYSGSKVFPSPTKCVNEKAKRLFRQITDIVSILVSLRYFTLDDARNFLDSLNPVSGYGRIRLNRNDIEQRFVCHLLCDFIINRSIKTIVSLCEDMPQVVVDTKYLDKFYAHRDFMIDRPDYDKAYKLLQARTRVSVQENKEVL